MGALNSHFRLHPKHRSGARALCLIQPRPWALPDEIGENRARLIETAAGEQQATDPLPVPAVPELNLVETSMICFA